VARNGDEQIGGPLGTTASVKISAVGISGVDPSELIIDQLGIGGEKQLRLTFATTDAPDPRLIVRSALAGEQPFALDVRPRVEITPRRTPLLGLGLGDTPVSVECVEAFGAALPLAAPAQIIIQCRGGRDSGAESLQVSDSARRAQFMFRSSWLGPAQIVATARTATQQLMGSVTIEQQMPWAQFILALAGGALGGFARRFVKGARRKMTGRRVFEGLIVGFVAFVAGVLGIGFLGLPAEIIATVAGAFLTGAAAGFAGVTVLEALTQKSRAGG
jgi:hypothetical protein